MYKTLCVAVLLLPTFALAQGTFSSPQIVAKAKLQHQTAAIPTTTIYTPIQTGLYRLSVYATLLSTSTNGSYWNYNLAWTDDAGPESIFSLLWGYDFNYGQFWQLFGSSSYGAGTGGPVITFEATAGQPITYTVTFTGNPDGTAYSLYYTLERLE